MSGNRNRTKFLLAAVAVAVFTFVLWRTAWLSDDAYITFRTVDNFVNGFGLTWNITERVQTYTHPLWMFLLSLFYLFTQESYYTAIFLSIGVSLAAFLVMFLGIAPSIMAAVLGFFILLFSKSFIDYSTSGLENPLTHLLLLIFLYLYIKRSRNHRTLFYLSLVAGLSMVNRMDTVLLSMPVIINSFRTPKSTFAKKAKILLAGFSPFIIWEIFSLIYYGFLFPNTAYAKLNTGISQTDYIVQGIYFLYESTKNDYLTLPVILVATVAVFLRKDKAMVPVALGIILYLLYILKIGGDFMSGRFLTAPLIYAVVILLKMPYPVSNRARFAIIAVTITSLGLSSPFPPVLSGQDYGRELPVSSHGVTDERAYYYQTTGLLTAFKAKEMPTHEWADDGRFYKRIKKKLKIRTSIGMAGYFAGQETHILDQMALADPLLAQLPVLNTKRWQIGHFTRHLPFGYIKTLKTGVNSIEDRNLANYYHRLTILTRGNLFSGRRFKEILYFNLRFNQRLIRRYTNNLKRVNLHGQFFDPGTEAFPWIKRCLDYDARGLADSSNMVHLQMIKQSVQIREEEEFYWGRIMIRIVNLLLEPTGDETGISENKAFQIIRSFSLCDDERSLTKCFLNLLNDQVPYNSFNNFIEVIGILKREKVISYLADSVGLELENLENASTVYSNLAIFLDLAGYPGKATNIYLLLSAEDIKIPLERKDIWTRVMVDQTSRYNKLILENPGNVDFMGFFLRLFIFTKDFDNIQRLLHYISNQAYSADDWKQLIGIARTSENIKLLAGIKETALRQYPQHSEFK